MVTPVAGWRHPKHALAAWITRHATSSDDIPTAYEAAQRALEAFLGRDGAERVAVEQAARTYEHVTTRGDDRQVHTHALVPAVDGLVDVDGLDTSRLVVEVDPDQPWGSPDYERWTAQAADSAVREEAARCRQLAAAWGRKARDKRLLSVDPQVCEAYQQYYQRQAQPDQARERTEHVLGLRPDPITNCTTRVEVLDRSHERGWSM